jgi:DNA gyrase/topoisomerase IV subunit A
LEEEDKIIDFVDHSSSSVRIEVVFGRSFMATATDDDIRQLLQLQWTVRERIVVINFDGDQIVEYDSAQTLVEDFVKWRFGYYTKRYTRLLAEQERVEHYWASVVACFKHGVPEKARGIKDKAALGSMIEAAVTKEKIAVDQSVTDRICNIPLHRWTAEGEKNAREHHSVATYLIKEYRANIKSDERRKTIFRNEVSHLKGKNYQ